MPFYNNALAGASAQSAGDGSYLIERSLRFTEGDTPFLDKVFSSHSRYFTVSFWMKLGRVDGAGSYDHIFNCAGNDGSAYYFSVSLYNNVLYIYNGAHNNATGRLLNDPGAWYHIVCSVSLGTATLYVNGDQVQQVTNCKYGGDAHIGNWNGGSYHFDGYLADINFIDGAALAPTDFAEYDDNNSWQPKKYTGAYNQTSPAFSYSATSSITSPANLFDGDTSTYVSSAMSSDWQTVTEGPITFTSGTFTYNTNNCGSTGGSSDRSLRLTRQSDGATTTVVVNDCNGWTIPTAYRNTPISKIEWKRWSSYENISAVYADGTILTDIAQSTGDKGFYLKFSDDSSATRLGSDSSGLGTSNLPCVSFDGSNDSLEIANHTDFSLGTLDWTIEYFVRPHSFTDYQATVNKYTSGDYSWWQALKANGTIVFYFYRDNAASTILTSSALTLYKWHHVAVVRDGNTLRMYINGVQVSTQDVTGWTNKTSNANVTIGEDKDYSYDFEGEISNVRIVNGTCLYGSGTTFTVPSTPLANVTNTKLLCCQSALDATAAAVTPSAIQINGNCFADTVSDGDFNVTNLVASVPMIASPNVPGWGSPGSNWTLTQGDSASSSVNWVATYGGTNSYREVLSNVLADNTTYHFFLEQTPGSTDSYGGWFFVEGNSVPSLTVPDELGGNTLGLRLGETGAGCHGNYATANGVTAGQDKINLGLIQASTNGGTSTAVEFVVNTTVDKVWVRLAGAAGWIGGGDPGTTTSTPSFNITSATNQRFGYMAYANSHVARFKTVGGDPLTVDSSRDSPSNGTQSDDGNGGEVTGNYCTWNPHSIRNGNGTMKCLDGNLNFGDQNTGSTYGCAVGTMAVSSGKWYFEITYGTVGAGVDTNCYAGIMPIEQFESNISVNAFNANNAALALRGDKAYKGDESTTNGYASGLALGDTIGIAFDVDAGTSTWYRNGVSLGAFPYGLEPGYSWTPYATDWSNAQPVTRFILNTGQRPWVGSPPAGYKAMCTANLPTTGIQNPKANFDIKRWTGTGGLELASTAINTSTAYRHHRILFEGDNNGGSVSEIQFFDASGLIDASDTNNAGSSVTSNSNQGLAAWTAFNGTLGGASYSYGVRKDPSSGFYIAKDWGSGNTKTITAVKIWGVDSYAIAGNTSSTYVKLQGSSDGTNWTDLQTWDDSRSGSWTSNSSTEVAHISDTARKIDGFSFSPDFVWAKNLGSNYHHAWVDTVRGAAKILNSSSTATDATNYTQQLTSFDSDGFSIGNNSDSGNYFNVANDDHVAWAWDAGDNSDRTYTVKVVSDSGNKYRFDGHGASAVTLDLEEGSTYVFDCSDNSVDSHPFVLGTSANSNEYSTGVVYTLDGVVKTYSQYTSGFASATTRKLTITIPASAPTLYYWCSQHSGMGGQINTNSTAGSTILSGSLSSISYDQSRTWSTYGSFDNHHGSGYEWDDVFNTNNIYNDAGSLYVPSSTTDTWTLTSGVAVTSSVKVYTYSDTTVTINSGESDETSVTGTLSGYGYVEVPFSGTVTKVSLSGGGGGSIYVMGIWFDGKRLVDDTETVTPVPSINSIVRASPVAGFSMVKYVGTTAAASVAHGLDSAPDVVIVKDRDHSGYNWQISHTSLAADESLLFTTAEKSDYDAWDNTYPDSNLFYLGAGTLGVNTNGNDLIAYCFTNKPGYFKAGKYMGRGNTSQFINLGFRPALVILKNTSTSQSTGSGWIMIDTARNPKNNCANYLIAEGNAAEGNTTVMDIYSNGFRTTNAYTSTNGNQIEYVYLAWAENPFRANGGQAR